MNYLQHISIIIPSFHSKDLLTICVNSIERFRPLNYKFDYIIVENSRDVTYKDEILDIVPDALWINNDTIAIGSEANAEAIAIGMKNVKGNCIFMCHCDICVTSPNFFPLIVKKYEDGNRLVGAFIDKDDRRIGAVHILGLLVDAEVAKNVSYSPRYEGGKMVMDVGDGLTEYCRNNNLKYYCFENTYNNPDCIGSLQDPYKNFNVARCKGENNDVIFMHLARGILKTKGLYNKRDKVGLDEWIKFCNRNVLCYDK